MFAAMWSRRWRRMWVTSSTLVVRARNPPETWDEENEEDDEDEDKDDDDEDDKVWCKAEGRRRRGAMTDVEITTVNHKQNQRDFFSADPWRLLWGW